MATDRTNIVCGIFLIVVGAIFAQQSLAVDLGTWLRIGPGGLPLVLSGLLILLGAIILISGLNTKGVDSLGITPWRGMFFIVCAPILFGLTIRGLGFIGAVFVTALFASFASIKMKPLTGLILAAGLTIFSTIVFSYGLQLPYPRVGPWLQF